MGARRSRDGRKLRVAGVVFILLAVATLILGIVWAGTRLSGMEFGEYASPPPGFWPKVNDALPIIFGVVAIPAMIGVILILISTKHRSASR